jgi:AbrB family looped-hinge helix DNA binding protein
LEIRISEKRADTMKIITGEIKAKGQLTVPKKIRDMLKLEEGQAVTFLTIGDSVIISPKRIDAEEARRQIRRIVRESGLTEEALLSELKKEREAFYREKYGKNRS